VAARTQTAPFVFLGGCTHCDLALYPTCGLPWRRDPLKKRALDDRRGLRRLGFREGRLREQHGLAPAAAVIPTTKTRFRTETAHAEHIGMGSGAANLMGLNGIKLGAADGADSPVKVHANRM